MSYAPTPKPYDPKPPVPLTESERAARTHDWITYDAYLMHPKTGLRAIIVHALNAVDAEYRVGLQVRKGEKVKSIEARSV